MAGLMMSLTALMNELHPVAGGRWVPAGPGAAQIQVITQEDLDALQD